MAAECFNNVASSTILLSIFGWVIIVIGWLWNNHQSNVRESRKELRSSLDIINKEINLIHEKAAEYFTSPAENSEKLAYEIKSSQQKLVTKIERLQIIHNDYFKHKELIKFMDVITGGDFEEKNRKERKYSDLTDNLLIEILYSANTLIDLLENDYCEIVKKVKKKKPVIYLN